MHLAFGNGSKAVADRHMVLFGAGRQRSQESRSFPITVPRAQFRLQSSKLGCGVVRYEACERGTCRFELRKAREAAHAHPDARNVDGKPPEQGVDTSMTTVVDR